ncbi:MAG: hypothetical protein ACW97V_20230 [Promethearchaeota archaeon]|jgi:hypothetical protein
MKNKKEKLLICMISLAFITSFSIDPLSMRGINTDIDDFSDSVSNLSTQSVFWPPNSSDWTEVAPETQELDSDKISEMFEHIEILSYDIHSVIITRNGRNTFIIPNFSRINRILEVKHSICKCQLLKV